MEQLEHTPAGPRQAKRAARCLHSAVAIGHDAQPRAIDVIHLAEIEDQFGISFDQFFAPELERLSEFEADGLVLGVNSPRIEVTSTGRIFIRTIGQVFDAFESAAVASHAV